MGLINKAQQPQSGAPPAPGNMEAQLSVPRAEDPKTDENNLTPDENEAFDAAMNMVADIIYADDNANSAIMEQLKGDDTPKIVAETTTFILDQIEQAFQGKVPETIIIPIADTTSDLLLELMDASGQIDLEESGEKFYLDVKGAVIQELFDAYGFEEADMEGMLQGVTAEEVTQMKAVFEEEQ